MNKIKYLLYYILCPSFIQYKHMLYDVISDLQQSHQPSTRYIKFTHPLSPIIYLKLSKFCDINDVCTLSHTITNTVCNDIDGNITGWKITKE